MSAPLAIGVGCRAGATPADIAELVRAAMQDLDVRGGVRLFTLGAKAEAANLREAAALLDLPLVGLSAETLAGMAEATTIQSPRVAAAVGVPSVAEAAALAGAGPGSQLIVPRLARAGVTCAIAVSTAA